MIGYNFPAAQILTEIASSSSSLPLHNIEAGFGYNSLDSQKLFQDPPPFPSLPEVLVNNFSVSSSSSREASISSLPVEENYIAWSGNGGSEFDNILMDFSCGSSHYDLLMSTTGYGFPEKADHEAAPLNPVNFGNYPTLVAAADNKAQGVYQYCHIR
ncbi:hypothetical protein H6P81_001040 [Aristolochia fimbriata]|uniref:Uncharacterized protein n=1 Tax=Aristolochia fimbriata TaxID=158543 RepID=A0AAV7F5X0_ARIFI|nr:hypothetical protein H6P81_001040 [Aristolochia fimbriata]